MRTTQELRFSCLRVTHPDLFQAFAAMSAETLVVCVDPVEPESEGLAKKWESMLVVRERLRNNENRLVKWPKDPADPRKECVGHMSMASIALNGPCLTAMAAWWCPWQNKAKAPSIDIIRREVRVQRSSISSVGMRFLRFFQLPRDES